MYSYRPQQRRPRGRPARRRALQGYVLPREGEDERLPRQRWRRILLSLAAVAGLAGLLALYFSPLLRVQEVQVIGATTVDPQAVRELADLEGNSMFHPPLAEAEKRIVALPQVKAVKTERRWPQGIRIEVVERQAWGYWQVGDKVYVVDSEGVVLESPPPPEGAPFILDRTSDRQLIVGDRVDTGTIDLAVQLTQAVPELFGLQVVRLEFEEATGLTAVTSADYRVVLGDGQNFQYKLAVWQALEERLGRETMRGHVLDLRFRDRPSFR